MPETAHRNTVDARRREYADSLAAQKRLLSLKPPLTALALAGAVALTTWVAVQGAPLWPVVVVLLALGVANIARARARVATNTAALLGLLSASSATDEERVALAELPHRFLRPSDYSRAEQIEQLFRPGVAEIRGVRTEWPLVIMASILSPLLMAVGFALSFVWPALFTVSNDEITPAHAWMLVPLLSGIPLLLLMALMVPLQRSSRSVLAQLVSLAQAELPRLWANSPTFAAGHVVKQGADGYFLDEAGMLSKPSLTKPQRFLERALPIATAVGMVLILLLAATRLDSGAGAL